MTMRCECTGCGEDCSHAYGTYMGDPYHFGCIPAGRLRRDRKLSDAGDVPTPARGSEGLPIPASQDQLRRIP